MNYINSSVAAYILSEIGVPAEDIDELVCEIMTRFGHEFLEINVLMVGMGYILKKIKKLDKKGD